MQKLLFIAVTLLGIAVGILIFILRKTPSGAVCRNAGWRKRELLLTAMIVSCTLSDFIFRSTRVFAKQDTNSSAFASAAAGATNNVAAIEQSKEWQDLKVYWNLVTGDISTLFEERGGRMRVFGIAEWKYKLLEGVLDTRMEQLDGLVSRGVMTPATKRAVARLFKGVTDHVYNSNSGATCYIMSPGAGQSIANVDDIVKQAYELREQFQKGTITAEVLSKVETQIRENLEALGLLGEFTVDEITGEEIHARVKQWQNQGMAGAEWPEPETMKQIVAAIRQEKEKGYPPDQLTQMKRAWEIDKKKIPGMVIDLSKYVRNVEAEKALKKELYGDSGIQRLLVMLKKAKYSYEKEHIIRGLEELGGKAAIPALQELLKDETLGSFQRSTDTEHNVAYLNYPVRDAAAEALNSFGVKTPKKSESRADSPEAREMVMKGLASPDLEVRKSAIRTAGFIKNTSFGPPLEKMLGSDTNVQDEVVTALGEIGDQKHAGLIITAAEKGTVHTYTAQYALERIGGEEVMAYFRKQATNDPNWGARANAIRALARIKDKSAEDVFRSALKDKAPAVRLAAAVALQENGSNEGFSVIADLSKSDNDEMRQQAFLALKKSTDPRAQQFLNEYAKTPDGEGQKQAAMAIVARGGDDGLAEFKKAMRDADPRVRAQALRELAAAKLPGVEQYFLEAWQDTNTEVNCVASFALKETGTTNTIRPLLTLSYFGGKSEISSFETRNIAQAIKERYAKEQLGDFLSDLSGTNTAKRAQAEERKKALSDDDLHALVVAMEDFSRPEPERKQAETLLKQAGKKSVRPILRYFEDVPSDVIGTEWQLMQILDEQMDETIPQVMEFIRDKNRFGRQAGLEILMGNGPQRKKYPLTKIGGLYETVRELCADSNPAVRAAAGKMLLRIKGRGPDALDTIIIGLNDPSQDVRFNSILALKHDLKLAKNDEKSRGQVVNALVKLLEREANDTKRWHVKYITPLLVEYKAGKAVPVLMKIIKQGDDRLEKHLAGSTSVNAEPDYTPSEAAAKALFYLGDETTVPFWKEVSGNSDEIVTMWSCAALCKHDQDQATNLHKIKTILQDTNMHTRLAGLEVLEALGGKQCVPILMEYLGNDDYSPSKDELKEPHTISSSNHSPDREKALKLLAQFGSQDVLVEITRLFRDDKDGYVRRAAADYIVALEGLNSEIVLLKGLADENPGVRFRVCELLGIVGATNAVAALRQQSKNDPYSNKEGQYEVRDAAKQAIEGLLSLRGKDYVNRLIAVAKNKNSNARMWAIEQLGNVANNNDVVETLKNILRDPDDKCGCGSYHHHEEIAASLQKLGIQVEKRKDGGYALK